MYDVRHVLRKAGLRSTYSGYNYLASAVALVLKDQEFYMKNVTSNLYRVVGEQYGVSNMCVEAAIRTMINSYWNQNSNKILSPLLGYPVFDNRPHPNLFRCWQIISRIIPLVNYKILRRIYALSHISMVYTE